MTGRDFVKIKKKDILCEAEAKLQALSLKPEKPVMVRSVSAGTLGTPFDVQTNVFAVNVKDGLNIWRYDVIIVAEVKGRRAVFFTKKGRDDFLVTNRNHKCKLVYEAVLRIFPDFFGHPGQLWYDGQSVLFSRKDLFEGSDKSSMNFNICGNDCCDDSLLVFEKIVFDIARVDENYCISISKDEIIKKACRLDLSEQDRSLTQFMEIVFDQLAIMNPKDHAVFENGKTFHSHPWSYGFTETDCPVVGDGKRLLPGTQKSVHFIEGKSGRGHVCPALVIDAKKAAFHESMPLIEKAKSIVRDDFSQRISELVLEKLNAGMKGLFFYTKHTGCEKDHQVSAIVNRTASDTTFELKDGVKISILQYFAEKYGISLRYPNAPLIKVRESGRVNNYPMELGWIRPMQRVKVSQLTPDQSHKTTKNCAIAPGIRQDNILKGAHALKLFRSDGNEFLENAGLGVYKSPMQVTGRLLPPPMIRYHEATAVVRDGKWRTSRGHFLMPAACDVWAIYAIVPKHEINRFNKKLLDDFVKVFFDEATSRGMKLRYPNDMAVTSGEAELEDCFKNAAQHSCKFCVVVSADSIASVHKKIKLWERQLEMVTQDVRLSTVMKVIKERRVITLENIILKTNMKLGGLNYDVDFSVLSGNRNVQSWFHPDRLFLGITVSHSCSGNNDPSVVGYAANFKGCSFDFVGDYLFQSSGREETLTTMSEVISNVIPKYAEHHGGQCPRDLIIYRSGISDGSFKTVLTHEIPLLRGALSTIGGKAIKLVFIVVQKKHIIRLMRTHIDRSRRLFEQNIPPGVVVDSNLTHPVFKEFYLNSHTTLQGSASTPRYTVLVDDLTLSMDELEGMTHVLTYAHQIVNISTCVPTPLYVANRYAERGRSNYEAHIICSGSSSSESGASIDYGRLAHRLSYNNTKLGNFRVNA